MSDALFDGQEQRGPLTCIPITKARPQLGAIARRVSHSRQEIALTDRGQVVAVIIHPGILEDLEDELALAQNKLDRLEGHQGTPHEEFLRELDEGRDKQQGAA